MKASCVAPDFRISAVDRSCGGSRWRTFFGNVKSSLSGRLRPLVDTMVSAAAGDWPGGSAWSPTC